MQLPNTAKLTKIQEELKNVLDTEVKHINSELTSLFISLAKLIEPKVAELENEVTVAIKEVLELNRIYENLKSEVTELEKKRSDFVAYRESLETRARGLDKEETDLLILHKVLENKRIALEDKENKPRF